MHGPGGDRKKINEKRTWDDHKEVERERGMRGAIPGGGFKEYSILNAQKLDEEFVRGIRSRPAVTTRDSIFVKVQKIIDHGSGRAAIKIKGKYFTI